MKEIKVVAAIIQKENKILATKKRIWRVYKHVGVSGRKNRIR